MRQEKIIKNLQKFNIEDVIESIEENDIISRVETSKLTFSYEEDDMIKFSKTK